MGCRVFINGRTVLQMSEANSLIVMDSWGHPLDLDSPIDVFQHYFYAHLQYRRQVDAQSSLPFTPLPLHATAYA